MIPIRTKIVLSLIGMSFLAIALIAVTARYIMQGNFDELAADQASEGFMREIVNYHRDYGGSWEKAITAESFEGYRKRSRADTPPKPIRIDKAGPASADSNNAIIDLNSDEVGRDNALTQPPSAFLVTDADGQIWIPKFGKQVGDRIPVSDMKEALPILDGRAIIGYAISRDTVALAETESRYLAALEKSWGLSLLLVAVIAIPIGLLLGNRLASPISHLNRAIQAMQPGSIHQQVPVSSKDELGLLSQSFNKMSGDLSSFVQVIKNQQKKILQTEALRKEGMASISHELRTPLNTSVAQANAMLDGVRPLDIEQVNKLSNSLDHLTKLVDDLFQLSLADVQALSCSKDCIDFSILVNEAIASKESEFSTKNLSVLANVPDRMQATGDATRLRQIIDNLLENCFRYTNTNGQIKVDLRSLEHYTELTVSDNGPGVSASNLESLFDRFFREDASRSRTTGGAGLGLALVKTWAEVQGGNASAFLSPEGGLGIRVSVPS